MKKLWCLIIIFLSVKNLFYLEKKILQEGIYLINEIEIFIILIKSESINLTKEKTIIDLKFF